MIWGFANNPYFEGEGLGVWEQVCCGEKEPCISAKEPYLSAALVVL